MNLKPLLKGAWISALPLTGQVAQAFRQQYKVGRLVNLVGCRWERKDKDKAVVQIKWLADNFDVVFGDFPPETLEAIRLAYLKFCHQEPVSGSLMERWPNFYSPVFEDSTGVFMRFAAIA